jgi:phosphoglycerate dehydrogenase-like enzyme
MSSALNQAPLAGMQVLLIPVTGAEVSSIWLDEVVRAVEPPHQVRFFEQSAPLAPQFQGVDMVVDQGGWGTRPMADAAAGIVRLWQILGVGVDHFDLPYWRSKEIPVANCPGSTSAAALAEHAFLLMLLLARKFGEAQQRLQAGKLYEPMGSELQGMQLGLVGFGASARELAQRAIAFKMRVAAIDVQPIAASVAAEYGLTLSGGAAELDDLIRTSDVVSLHVPLDESTRNLIDKRRLDLLNPSAILINVARGPLVDEVALAQALAEGRLGGAGLDVFSHEPPDANSALMRMPNVVATPHIAGSTDGTARRRAQVVAENVRRLRMGQDPIFRVDT